MRISLTYDNPERVLEFDVNFDLNRVNVEQTKPQLLSLMLHQVLQLGHKSILYPEIIKHARDGFGAELDKNQIDSVLFTLNAISPGSFQKGLSMRGLTIDILTDISGIESIVQKLH